MEQGSRRLYVTPLVESRAVWAAPELDWSGKKSYAVKVKISAKLRTPQSPLWMFRSWLCVPLLRFCASLYCLSLLRPSSRLLSKERGRKRREAEGREAEGWEVVHLAPRRAPWPIP